MLVIWGKIKFVLSNTFSKDTIHRSLFISTVIACLCSIAPPIFFGKVDLRPQTQAHELGTESNLETALGSHYYQQALYTSVIISLPMLVECVLDWYFSTHPSAYAFLAMWSLLISILVPDVLLLLLVCPYNSYQYFPTIWATSQYFMMTGIMSLLSEYGGPVLNNFFSLLSINSYFLYLIMSTFTQFQNNIFKFIFLYFIRYVLLGLTFIGQLFSLWFWVSHLRKKKQSEISRHDIICSCLLSGVVLLTSILLSILFIEKSNNLMDRNTTYLTLCCYMFTAYAVFGITITGRTFRYDMSRMHERRAQELDQKRSFVRYVSHEIRTPLNTVLMGLQLLKREVDSLPPSDSFHHLGTIVEDIHISCNTAVEILNEILDYEKLQAGILQLELKEVLVVVFVGNCVSSFELAALEKNIELEVEFHSESMHQGVTTQITGGREGVGDFSDGFDDFLLKADPWKLSQVLRNLLSNAIKFTGRGGHVHIDVSVVLQKTTPTPLKRSTTVTSSFSIFPERKPIPKLVITVSDSGPGISQENQSRLFKEIVQFEPGKLQEGKGSGVGLWISKRILDLHKGSISVFSEGEGRGSKFTVELPLEHRVQQQSPPSKGGSLRDLSRYRSSRHASEASQSSLRVRNLNIPPNQTEIIRIIPRQISGINLRLGMDIPVREFSYRDRGPSARVAPSDTAEVIAGDTGGEPDPYASSIYLEKASSEMRALVVDDAPMNRKMLQRLLEHTFQTIDQAEDGLVAVDKVKKSLDEGKPYQTVLIDFQMPNMDGPTAARTMRDLGFEGTIIGITGNALAADVEWFIAHGANQVLPKPVNFQTLLSILSDPRNESGNG